MGELAPELALRGICTELSARRRKFALVGGLAVSIRAEVRFTRDVDIAVSVENDEDAEALIYELRSVGYEPVATVEHEARSRLSTVRLLSPQGVKVDLLFATSGIEEEIVARASFIEMGDAGRVPVANAEELLAMKILSMTDIRLQDRLDAQRLLQFVPDLDLQVVRGHLARIAQRGFHRDQDLSLKLESVLATVRS